MSGEAIPLGRLHQPATDAEVESAMLMVSIVMSATWTAERLAGGWLFTTPRGTVASALAFPDAVCEATGHPVNYQRA